MHGWRALYVFEGAPPVSGAMRVRDWTYAPHWLRFRWKPELEPGDSTIPSLLHEDEFDGDAEATSHESELAFGSAD